ncbi:hypothetical protein ACLMJK_009672 [Lecanora helva]
MPVVPTTMPASSSPIPRIYRILFLYFEPAAAFGGVVINLFDPIQYLQSLSPAASSSTYSPLTQPIYEQLAAHLLFFAWSQAIVLRSTNDTRVWKAILFGMFLCDVIHLFASYRILGAEVFMNPTKWRWEEWVNFVMLYGPGSLRLAFCAGIGLGRPQKKAKR